MFDRLLHPQWIATLADNNPAVARLIKLSLYSAVGYILAAITAGNALDPQAFISAIVAPLLAYIDKAKRTAIEPPADNPPTE